MLTMGDEKNIGSDGVRMADASRSTDTLPWGIPVSDGLEIISYRSCCWCLGIMIALAMIRIYIHANFR
jgi:hypothetical protein